MNREGFALAFACVALSSCASTPPVSPSLPPPYDTKYEFRLVDETLKEERTHERMYWVDNDRLLFQADVFPIGVQIPQEGGSLVPPQRSGLYLWDERERKVRQVEERAFQLCYTDGILSYVTRRGDQRLYLEGPIGAMKETPLASDLQSPLRARCRSVPADTIPQKVYPLLGGGFLEDRIGAPGGTLPYRYYSDLKAAPIELPINPLFTGVGLHRYSEYTRSHIFKSTYFDRASRTTAILEVLPDGSTRTLAITDGPWSRGVLVPLPTARGWLLATALNGVYLMRGADIEKISPGQVRDIAVSPDGCRVALKMHFGTGNAIRPTPVYTVNLCERGERK